MRFCRLYSGVLVVLALTAAPVWAQATRREAVEQQRAARAARLTPYKPGRLERALFYIEQNRLAKRLSGADRVYLRLGSVQRGGGFALGGGYRTPFASGRLAFNADAAISMKGYRVVGADVSAPRLLSGRLTLVGRG